MNSVKLNRQKKCTFTWPFEHFYQDTVFGNDCTTHYVVLGYSLTIDIDLSSFLTNNIINMLGSKMSLLSREDVHLHSKWYVT